MNIYIETIGIINSASVIFFYFFGHILARISILYKMSRFWLCVPIVFMLGGGMGNDC